MPIFFPVRGFITSTITSNTVKKGDYIFMGAYSLQAGYGVGRGEAFQLYLLERLQPRRRDLSHTTRLIIFSYVGFCHGLYRGFFCQ